MSENSHPLPRALQAHLLPKRRLRPALRPRPNAAGSVRLVHSPQVTADGAELCRGTLPVTGRAGAAMASVKATRAAVPTCQQDPVLSAPQATRSLMKSHSFPFAS